MLRYTIPFCLCAILVAVTPSYGQVDPSLDALRTVIPPSPNVSALAKFGEWPVSLYTGVPEIDIPIYELKGRSISVPISVNYHAAGIRVGETASWVGLGWALNAGGCISRTVQGLPDEYGYLTLASNYTNPNDMCGTDFINATTLQNDETQAAQGQMDTQMDIYNMNVLGKSYRIYINAANDSAYTMPTSNIRITGNFLQNTVSSQLSTWSAILEDGTKLFFGGINPGNYVELTSNSTMTIGNFVSAWYLQSIVTPTGETITFTYTPTTITQPAHTTQSDYISYLTGSSGPPPTGEFLQPLSSSSLTSVNTITQLSLSTIQSDLTTVYFIPADTLRLDLDGGVALSEIKVYSKLNGQYVGDWLFNYAYSQAAAGNPVTSTVYNINRLKLMGLTSKPSDGSPPQIWSFGYNPTSLPSQISYAQDYWGFYNGANSNTSLLPTIPFNASNCTIWPTTYTGPFPNSLGLPFFTATGFIPPDHDAGNNRSANPTYMQAEMLNKITYPTGGYTVFNYEGNSQPVSQQVIGNTTPAPLSILLTASSNPYTPIQSYTFTLTEPGYINVAFTSSISAAIFNDFTQAAVAAEVSDASGVILFSYTVNSATGNVNQWVNVYLPGTYTLTLFTNVSQDEISGTSNFVSASANLTYPASQGTQAINQFLGGVRLNNMQQFDGISATPINSQYYTYSSPMVINPVDTVNDFLTVQNLWGTYPANGVTVTYTKVTRSASSKYALGTLQGGTVGYGQVTTSYGVNGANGYTISTFSNDPASQASPASKVFPYPPTDPHSWRSGILTAEQTYDSYGQLLKSAYNTYRFLPATTIYNFKSGWATIYSGWNPLYSGEDNQAIVNTGITSLCYNLTNEQVQKAYSTESAFDQVTGDSLSTLTSFYYDDPTNTQPTRTVSFNSKGDSVLTYSRTPLELPAINASIPLTASATAALDTMMSRNIVAKPVETERYVNSVLAYKALTNYMVQPTGLVLPNNVMIENAAYPIETRLNLLEYDNYGNLLEQAKSSDENHNYIYDYVSSYPIAEVVNADSTSIAYTSFESNGTGGWTLGSGSVDTTKGLTGSYSYIPSGGVSRSGLNSTVTYVVSYWMTGTTPITITGTLSGFPIQGKTITINGYKWTYYEYKVTGVSSVSLSGSVNIDELRLYPATAQMTTYTYSPLVGMSSQCDADNRVTYYQYDSFNRLKDIKDQDGNVVKTYQYHYQ